MSGWEEFQQDVAMEEYEPPGEWDGTHVIHRMVEACEISRRMPNNLGMRRLVAAWPSHNYEFSDLRNWEDLSEIEKGERYHDMNRTRLKPTQREIDFMDEALQWPLTYLNQSRHVAIVVWAMRRVQGKDSSEMVAAIVQAQADNIADGLRRDRVAVR